MTAVLTRRQAREDTEMLGGGHGETEAETEVVDLQAKKPEDCGPPPAVSKEESQAEVPPGTHLLGHRFEVVVKEQRTPKELWTLPLYLLKGIQTEDPGRERP